MLVVGALSQSLAQSGKWKGVRYIGQAGDGSGVFFLLAWIDRWAWRDDVVGLGGRGGGSVLLHSGWGSGGAWGETD